MDALSALYSVLTGNLDSESIRHLVNEAAQADLTAWTVKIGLVWVLMGRKVRNGLTNLKIETQLGIQSVRSDFTDHFAKVEQGFKDMIVEVKSLKESVAADLKQTGDRVGGIEKDMSKLNSRVDKLETKGQ